MPFLRPKSAENGPILSLLSESFFSTHTIHENARSLKPIFSGHNHPK
ncbi:hypothetical protein EVA_16022 [gut metagenome]|uniref:Uncharacterized protein n=1 Tax=gut metagenome TaxID=749906 RepID=J9FLS3_9ZZZZ